MSKFIRDMNIGYKLEKCIHYTGKYQFDLFISSNVIGTNDKIYDERFDRFLGCARENAIGASIRIAKKKDDHGHVPVYVRLARFWPPVRLYKDMNSKTARKPMKRIREHIAFSIAPRHEILFNDKFMNQFSQHVRDLISVHNIMNA